MGVSYISTGLQGSLNNRFNDLHATFARPIAIFKTAKEIVVSTTNNHNFLFNNAPTNDIVQEVVQSGVFMARVLYGKKQSNMPFAAANAMQPGIQLELGEVRLRLDPTGAAYFDGSDRAKVDGNILKVTSSTRPHGLFAPNFYDLYFRKLD